MTSVKLTRIETEEAGPFNVNGGRTRMKFQVPGSVGFTDLTNSQLVLRMKASCSANGALNTLIPVGFSEQGAGIGGAAALVRSAKVTSQDYGVLNEQTSQNVVRANLEHYKLSTEEERIMQTYDGGMTYCGTDVNIQSDSPFLEMSRPVAVDGNAVNALSQFHYEDIRLPMSCIDLNGEISQFPNAVVGDIEYDVELENVKTVLGTPNDSVGHNMENITAVASEIGVTGNPLIHLPVGGAYKDYNIDQIPFYVGEPVTVSYTDGAGAKTHDANIEELTVTAAGQLQVVLDTAAPTDGATDACTAVSIQMKLDSPTLTWTIDEAYLELHVLRLSKDTLTKAMDRLKSLDVPWYDYKVTAKVLNATSDFSDIISLDPGCVGLCILTPETNELVSGGDKATSYRFLLNGKNVSNRDVQLGSITKETGLGNARQLHNINVMKWFGNLGKAVKKLDAPVVNYTGDTELRTHHIYPLVVPISDEMQTANIRIRSSADMSTKEIYYVTVYDRSHRFRNGKLVQ